MTPKTDTPSKADQAWKEKAEQAYKAVDEANAALKKEQEAHAETMAALKKEHAANDTLSVAATEAEAREAQWRSAATEAVKAVDLAIAKGRFNSGSPMDQMFNGLRELIGTAEEEFSV